MADGLIRQQTTFAYWQAALANWQTAFASWQTDFAYWQTAFAHGRWPLPGMGGRASKPSHFGLSQNGPDEDPLFISPRNTLTPLLFQPLALTL